MNINRKNNMKSGSNDPSLTKNNMKSGSNDPSLTS